MTIRRASTQDWLVLDAGALIALENADRMMTSMLGRCLAGTLSLVVPDAVLAEVWRGGHGRQARLSALLGLKPEQCQRVPLDTGWAKRIGSASASSGHSDVVDIHVALLTLDLGAGVVTSDRAHLLKVAPGLKGRILDI